MDASSGVSLPSITAPSDAFDLSSHYHDLHVMTVADYTACAALDSTCFTNSNKVDGSHAFIELVNGLNSLNIGQASTMNVKASLIDTSLADTFNAIWVIKDATDTTIIEASQ